MKNKYDRSKLAIFASFYRPHRKLFAIDMSCAAFVTATDLAFPYISKLSMERFLPENLFAAFFTVMGILALAYVIRALMYYVITYWGHIMGVRIEADMREEIFSHMQTLSFSYFDKNRTGVLMSRITSDLFEITELAHHGPEDFFMSAVTLIGAFCILLTIRWELALILFAILPIFVIFIIFQRRRMRTANIEVKKKLGVINASVESGISGIRTAKAFANEQEENEKFAASNKEYKSAKALYYRAMATFFSGMEFTTAFLQVVVIAAGGWFIMKGRMDYIDLFTFSLYVSAFVNPIKKLANFTEQYMMGMAGFSRFLEIMRTKPDIEDKPDAVELEKVKGDIEYRDVSFSYKEGVPVLSHVDLRIPAGSCLAVVGPSGGGKTTLCQLLPRFYDVTNGAVLLDGTDVRDLKQAFLHRSVGIIQQDVFMFAGTIRENIRYGRPNATDAEVVAAAVKAEIHKEIMEMPDGYDTYIGERGVMLSGGQKQRISIARVFLKNPPVLILDEATSALDTVTEVKIQKALDELSVGRTSIVIAHRLSTIRNADRIAVVEDEHVCETGTHAELLAKGGLYAELYNSQTFAE